MAGFPWPLIVLPALGFTAIGLILRFDAWLDQKDAERRALMWAYLISRAEEREREARDVVVTLATNDEAA